MGADQPELPLLRRVLDRPDHRLVERAQRREGPLLPRRLGDPGRGLESEPDLLDERVAVQRTELGDGRHARPTMSSGRTGTRVSGRPQASRIAATIAGVDEIVGASAAPFSP